MGGAGRCQLEGFSQTQCRSSGANPAVVLCHPKEIAIDKDGKVIPDYMEKYHKLVRLNSSAPHERFHDIACLRHACFQVFGVLRSSVLRSTPKIASYIWNRQSTVGGTHA
jgi:hypothetical protein